MTTYDEIKSQLLVSDWEGVNRYNPQTLDTLEDCLIAQMKENKYDLEINLTILKLYQLNPGSYKSEIVAKILLKCLMAMPKSDVVLAKSLIDQAHMDEDPVKLVLELSDLMEGCNFTKVWELLKVHGELIEGLLGFDDAVRNFVCHVVNITYQNIAFPTLKALLGDISDDDVKSICKKREWEMKEDNYVHVYNHEATVKSRNIEEKVDFASIQDILRASAGKVI